MAVSFVASASVGNTNNTDATSVVCSKPSGTASGDIMVALFTAPWTGSLTYTAPSGWSLASSTNGGGGVSLWSGLYYKIAGGSEPSTYTWQCSAGGSLVVGTVTYRADHNGWNLYFSHDVGTTTNPVTQPSSTPSGGAPFLAAHAISWHDAGGSNDSCSSSGGTERWDLRRTDGSPSTHERGSACYVNTSPTAGGGTDSGATMTLSPGAPTSYVSWVWSLSEEPYGTIGATLGGVTGSLAGTVTSGVTGTVAASLGGVTASLAGAELTGGPLAATLGHATSSMAGTMVTGGPMAATLGGVTGLFASTLSGPRVQLLIDDEWTDVTTHVRYDAAVSLSTGRTAEGTTMTTTFVNFTLDNRTETVQNRFSLRNPDGIYYGKIGRNTKVRIQDLEYGYRFHGEVSSWAPCADSTNNDQYVALECSGIVRRLSAGSPPVLPAMQREVMANSPVAYWPCDESTGATSFSSPLPSSPNLSISGGVPDFGDYTALKCAGQMPQVNTSSWRSPSLAGTSMTNGVTVAFLLASPGGITNGTRMARVDFQYQPSGVIYPWAELQYSSTNQLTLAMFPLVGSAGSIVGTVPIVSSSGVLVYMAFGVNGSGDIKFGLWYQRENDTAPVLVDTSAWAIDSGSVLGDRISLTFNPSHVDLSSNSAAYMGQIAVWDGYGPSGSHSYASVGAYAGEAAGTRFARLCTEEGITHTVANASNSSAMGAQLGKTTLDLLQECEATDMGIMYELRDDFGLGYIVRRDLYNQDATLTLDYSAGDLNTQLQPVFDDKGIANDVTVKRVDGGDARYQVTTGPLSTQDAPDGVGSYASSISASLWLAEQCYAQAGWRAHIGTVDEERITSLGVALENARFAASTDLRNAAMDVMAGSRITVINAPDWTSDVDQIVQGYTERFDRFTHSITYNTSSAAPYNTATVAATPTATSAKADSLTSTLHTDIDDDDTSISVTVTGVLWTVNASADFDINLDGEQINVSAVSGTTSPQTFAITRGDKAKAHTAGAQIRLWQPSTVGL